MLFQMNIYTHYSMKQEEYFYSVIQICFRTKGVVKHPVSGKSLELDASIPRIKFHAEYQVTVLCCCCLLCHHATLTIMTH